jgi:nucleoid-associated protein YgaU
MGLLSFIKSAGEKLFGSAEEEKKIEAEVQETNPLAERVEQLKRQRALQLKVEAMDLAVEDLQVTVDGGKVTIGGKVADQATSEKVALTVGNVSGVESVDNQLEVTNPEPEAQFHTVERGDTLSAIAKKFYGNANKYPVIFEANKPMLKHPDKIYPGQVLRIPPIED